MLTPKSSLCMKYAALNGLAIVHISDHSLSEMKVHYARALLFSFILRPEH